MSRFLRVWAVFFAVHSGLAAQNVAISIQGPTVVCPDCYQYRVVVTAPGGTTNTGSYSYHWTQASLNGEVIETANDSVVKFCFYRPGSYKVSVRVSTPGGLILGVSSIEVQVLPYLPLKIVSANASPCATSDSIDAGDKQLCDRVCPRSAVVYSVEGPPLIGPPANISWSVIGADSFRIHQPQRTSITVYWGAAGVGSVTVVFVGDSSTQCYGSAALCVTVVEEPQAAFEVAPAPTGGGDTVRICKGQTVWFDNRSQYAERYEWFFGDDLSVSYSVHAQHRFEQPGVFAVRLTAISGCRCTDTAEVIVEVLDAESPVLTCVGDLCAGAAVTYRAGSNCSGMSWSISANGTVVGGGLPGMDSIVIRWNTGPVGSVWLTPQSCTGALCPFPTLVRIPILDDNAQIEGRERVCPDAEEVYSIEPYGGTGFVWALSGGGTIVEGQGTSRVLVRWSASPNPNNVYRLSVRYDNCYLGCGGKDTISVRILSPFYVNGPVEACEGVGANFLSRLTVNNQNLATHWTLTGPDGSVVWTSAAPAASVTAPLNAGGGYYRMRAVAANPLQTCTDMREWRVRVPSPPAAPSAIEGPTVICPGRPLTYTAKGIPAGNAVQWTVQNGPGVPQTLPGNPVNVTWGATGPYRLAVQAVSSDGLNCASATTTLDVQSVGGAALSGPDTVCIGETATYSLPNLADLDVQWSVKPDDAGVLTAGQGTSTATVYWAKGGVHALQATVCGQMLTVPIAVSPAQPATVVHPPALCPSQTGVVRAAQAYAHYRWSDASGKVLSVADSALLGPGHYVLEATDENGCSVKAAFSVAHRETPYVTLSTGDPTVFCTPQSVTLQAVVNTGGGLTYEWFKDGLPVGGNTPTYTTNQFGQYTVRVTNAAGCSATAGPIAVVQDCSGGGGGGFSIPGNPGPCPPNQVTLQVLPSGRCDSLSFQASGPDYQMGSAQWFFFQWGRGILATDAGDRVGRHFSEVGLYQVILTAKTTSGATCYVAEPFPVEAVARFSAPTVCVGEPLSFREESSHLPNSAITQWTWDFGDPASGMANTSTLREPEHTFLSPGTYAVRLTVTASSGCTASASRSVAVQQPPPPTITAPPKGCEGTALLFEGTGENLRWNFGHPASGSLNVAEGSPAYHAFSAGTYTVTAIATDAYGCTATATQTVTVAPNLLGGLISPAQPAPVCTGGTLTLSAPPGADTYRWSEGSQGHTLSVSQEGVYGVTLTDANGCTYAPPAVPVRFLPEPVALIKAAVLNEFGQTIDLVYPSHSVCAGEDVFLVAQGQGNLTFSWSTGVNGTRIEFSRQRNNLLPIGTHFYTVTITDQTTGCTAVSPPFVVTVNPVPSGFFITNNAFPPCAGTLNTLQYNGPNPGNWQLIWNTGQVGAPLSTTRPGRYFLRVVNEFGCEARSNVLTVLPGPPVSAIPAGCHTRCRPDTLCMPPLPNVVSWQWFFNGSLIPGANSPALAPQQSGTYHAVLTDNYGCTSRSGPLTLELYDGFGSIEGQVWSDVNGNGAIDAGDTLVRGIPIRLIQGSATVSNGLSGANGNFAFANIPAGTYTVAIDTNALPPGWKIVIGQRSANLVGCDARAQGDLLLRQVCLEAFTTAIQMSACAGEEVLFNGTPIPAGSSRTFAFTSTDGCDSLVTVSVSAIPTSEGVLRVSACSGSFYDYQGTPIPAGGSATFVLTNAAGCDSVLTVVASELPATSGVLNVSACAGGFYDYQGTPIPAGGSATFVLTNAAGCDSVLTVVVSEVPVVKSTLRVGACPGRSFVYQGVALPVGAMQDFVLTNSQGCDSIVTVVVGALPTSIDTLAVKVCPGEAFMFNGMSLQAGETRQFVFANAVGCDSVVVVQVSDHPTAAFGVQVQASCANIGTGSATVVQPAGGQPPYQYSLDGVKYQDAGQFSNLSPGIYRIKLKDANGCTFERPVEVPALEPLRVALDKVALLPCREGGVVLRPEVSGTVLGLSYAWSTGAQTLQVEVSEPGTYTVEVSNVCERVRREVRVQWEGVPLDFEYFYMPNVFAPASNDPDNSQFRPYFVDGLDIQNYRLEIFDRWGNLLFRTDDPQAGWHGPFRAADMQPAVFVWHLTMDVNYCGRTLRIRRSGDVTLVR